MAHRPRAEAGTATLPGHKTPLKNFYLTGDYTFPGIGRLIQITMLCQVYLSLLFMAVSVHLSLFFTFLSCPKKASLLHLLVER